MQDFSAQTAPVSSHMFPANFIPLGVFFQLAMGNDPCVDDLGPIRMATFHRPTTQWNRGLPGEIPFQHETPSWKLVFSIFLVDW